MNCQGSEIVREVKRSDGSWLWWCFLLLAQKRWSDIGRHYNQKKDGKERVESKHIQIWHGLLFWWRSQVLMRILCKMLNDDYMYTFQLLEYYMGHMRKRGHRGTGLTGSTWYHWDQAKKGCDHRIIVFKKFLKRFKLGLLGWQGQQIWPGWQGQR